MGRTAGEGICFRDIEYRPLPSQTRFHASDARFKGFSGPVGSGKSQALCHEAVRLSYMNPGRLGLLGAPTYTMLRDATQSALFEILNRSGIPYEYQKSENVLVMKDTGSKVIFRPIDEFERLRGTNLAWFGLDELTYTGEEAWLRLEARLRDPAATKLCGFAVWTPKGFDWVYRRFVRNTVEGYDVTIASPYENRYLLDKVPDFYERLKKSYDVKFFEQEVLGGYLNVNQGLVYHAFDRSRNLVEVDVDPGLPLLWGLDFNVDPMCSVVIQIRDHRVVVIDEIILSRAGTEEACEEFCGRYPNHGPGVIVYGDASGARMQTSGTTDYEIIKTFFRRNGYNSVDYRIPRSNPYVRERVNLVNAMLKSAGGESRLLINSKCEQLIVDFEEVSYKAGTCVIDKEKDTRRTHLSDALGYVVWQECRHRRSIGEQDKDLFS
jgi:hypothetical protein